MGRRRRWPLLGWLLAIYLLFFARCLASLKLALYSIRRRNGRRILALIYGFLFFFEFQAVLTVGCPAAVLCWLS